MECSWRHLWMELGPRPCICALLWLLAWWHKATDWWCRGISEGIHTCTCMYCTTHCTQYFRCGAYPFYLSIQIWSLTTKPGGRLLNDLALHVDWVNCVLYSPSGHHILSAGDNGIIKVRNNKWYDLIMYIHLWTVSRFCGMKTRMRVRSLQSWMDRLYHTTTADLLYILQRILRDMSLLLFATFLKSQSYR